MSRLMRCLCMVMIVLAFLPYGSKGQTPDMEMITGFYQTYVKTDKRMMSCLKDQEWGNCVTIAIIKAAASQFGGFRNAVSSLEKSGDNTKIIFDDELTVDLTQADLDTARKYSGFGKLAAYQFIDSAELVYAAICKRILVTKARQYQGHCMVDFRDAVFYVNAGYVTSNAGDLLGLKLVPIRRKNLKSTRSAIINSNAHTAFCSYGFQDILGRSKKAGFFMHNPIGLPMPVSACYVLAKRKKS